jgi:hypothetical protein
MTKEVPSTNDQSGPKAATLVLAFGFGHSLGFGHLSFVIGHAVVP